MNKAVYSEKLKDPRWQKKRLEIFKRDGWACRYCFDSESMLAIHHTFYKANCDPWDYPDESLVTLCRSCHEAETQARGEVNATLIDVLRELPYTSVGDLARGLHDILYGGWSGYPGEVALSIVCWLLETPSKFNAVANDYFKTIGENR
jgi:hypothetical protein